MHGTKAQRNAAKTATNTATTKQKKEKKPKVAKTAQQDEATKLKAKRRKDQIRGEIANQQPLSTAKSVAKQMAHAQVQLQVKALPSDEAVQSNLASQSTQSFTKSMFHYQQVPKHHADMILMGDTKARRHEAEMIRYVDSPLLKVTDPVLRETIRQVENTALKADKERDDKITQYILSTLTGNEKVKAMIKAGASNKIVLNAMYNLLPRIMPTRKLRHNVDQLDWLGQIRHRWQNEIEPNGYDVEDSSDPDTLPQQRPFTRDEMHRLLQDVEESRYVESDVEENLFAPAVAIGDLKRELQSIEIETQLRFVLKNHQGTGAPPESFNYKAMRRNFKLLLGSQQTEEESMMTSKIPDNDDAQLQAYQKFEVGHDGTPNELSQSLSNSILEVRKRREKRIGVPYLFGSHAGAMDAQDFLLPATITNAGLGLMPPMFDVLSLPVHYIHDATEKNEKIDMFNDAAAPFQSRFDIACAVVLNRIMGPAGRDIPVYLTDSIAAETKLKNHPQYRKAQLAMLQDLKAGSNTAVESIQALMKEGFHPQDVMKRLVKHLDMIFDDNDEKRYLNEVHFSVDGEICDLADAAISFTGDDLSRLQDYHRFIAASMKTAKVINQTEQFTKGTDTATIDDESRPSSVADGLGDSAKGLLKSSHSKVNFENYQLQTDADGNFVSVLHASSDAHPESIVARSQLAAQEYGIGNVHRATPTQIDLSNNLGIGVTEPQSSPFGFRPNQKTIYGKQIAADQDTFEHEVGGLASREVPATRFTTDGTEISLDPHRAANYTNKEMLGALDNYHKYVKPRIQREQIVANETADLFQPGTHGLSELLRFQLKNEPDYNPIYDSDDTDQPLPFHNALREDHAPDVDGAEPDMHILAPGKEHMTPRRLAADKLALEGVDALNSEEKRAAYRLTRENVGVASDDSNSYTDIDIALDNATGADFDNSQFRDIDDVQTQFNAPHLVLEHKLKLHKTQKALGDLLNDPFYRDADINWAPLTNFSVQYGKFLLNRFEKKEDSREKKFRAFCKSEGLALTEWDSDFNKLIRRVYDGDISNQLTHAARQATREEQLAALVPILKDWKKVLEHDRSHLLNPTDAVDTAERDFRAKEVEKFLTNLRVARAQIRLLDEEPRYAHVDKPGYAAVAAGAVLDDDWETPEADKLPIDSFVNHNANAKKIKVQNEAGEVASVGTIVKPVTDVKGGFDAAKSPVERDVVPVAGGAPKLHQNKYTLFDLFEGRLKIPAGGDNAPAITDFDFRSHYMDKVAKDVEAFNTKYYIREEFSTFEELLATIPDAGKLPSVAIKLLKAKTQIGSNKYVNFKRNDVAYQDGDVDPLTGRELKIKSLGVADVDSPLSEELLGSIQRHHRLMLNQSDQPHQFNVDIDSYLNALESNGGDRDAALAAAESKMDMIPNEALSKQLKRYLQAWRASDIEAEAQRVGQGHDHEKVDPQEGVPADKKVKPITEGGDDDVIEVEHTPEAVNAAHDHIARIYSRYTMGYDMFQETEFQRYQDLIDQTGEFPPALQVSSHLRLLFKEWQARALVRQFDLNQMMVPKAKEATLEDGAATPEDVWDRPDQGLGFQHLHRTTDKDYQKTMDLPVDGDEMDHLRDSLSKSIFDPTHEKHIEDRVEWFNEPDLQTPFDHKSLTSAVSSWMHGDPFLQYLDTIPPGVKEAEVLRSSFSMIPPRLLDAAIKAKEGDEDAKFGRRRNSIRYNPAFSNTQIRKFRRGLEKYSGIPMYLLDFAEVAFNPHRPFFVHASIEENHLRNMMTEERLRQPARPLIAERPDDSDNDTPGVSTPITIGGTPATRQAAHVQKHYQTLAGTERLKRIQKFKKDLSVAQKDEFFSIEPATELDEEEANIAQDMFQRSLDRLLQRNATAFLTSDYDMTTLRQQYGDRMAKYEAAADRRRRMQELDEKPHGRVRRLPDGTVLLGDEIGRYENGFNEPMDTSDEDEWYHKTRAEHMAADPNTYDIEQPTDLEDNLVKERMNRFRDQSIGETDEELGSPLSDDAAFPIKKAQGAEGGDEAAAPAAEGADKAAIPADGEAAKEASAEEEIEDYETTTDYRPLQPLTSPHAYVSTKYPFALQDFAETYAKYLTKTDRNDPDFVQDSVFTRRILQIQNDRLNPFDKSFLEKLPLNRDPAGLDLREDDWEIFFDRKSQALPLLGRHKQTLRVMAESFLRHRRLEAEGKVTGDYQPHEFELAWCFERLYGLQWYDDADQYEIAQGEYRTFIRANRPRLTIRGVEVGTDDEAYNAEIDGDDVQYDRQDDHSIAKSLASLDIEVEDLPDGDFKLGPDGIKAISPSEGEEDGVVGEQSNATTTSKATGKTTRTAGAAGAKGTKNTVGLDQQLDEEELEGATAFDPMIAKMVEEETFYTRLRMLRPTNRGPNDPNNDLPPQYALEAGSEDDQDAMSALLGQTPSGAPSSFGAIHLKNLRESIAPDISIGNDSVKPSIDLLRRNDTLGSTWWDDAEFFGGELPNGKKDDTITQLPLVKRPGAGLGLAEHFDKLPRAQKVEFLLELLQNRQAREIRSSRRDDIVATVFGTQRQLVRRLSDELQLVKRAERTAFKRIFALDPDYARELVSRHLMYATGRRHANDEQSGPASINWKVELNYIEEIMWSSANRLNARTGGMFPGTPGVSRAHDKTFFTPPPLIAGEFAPMFVDQNMISSGDEYEQARTRLQYHGNADFVACGVTQWRTMGKKKQSMADNSNLNDDTKPVMNTRRYIDDGLARDAVMQLKQDFSQYEFTSDVEEPLIQDSIAQLSLDAGTNMAFASAIASHRKRLDDRRTKIESQHPLFHGNFDPDVDWHGGSLFSDAGVPTKADGSPTTGHTILRHRLKSMMRGKGDLNRIQTPVWSGLYAVDQLDYNEDGTPGEKVMDLLEGVNNLLKRTQKVNVLSSGHLLPAGDEEKGLIVPRNSADVEQYFKSTPTHLDAPFDTNGAGAATIKASASQKLSAAVEQSSAAKAKATTDVLGNVMIPSKYKKLDAKKEMSQDKELETAVLAEQAYQRYHTANYLMQANALTLRVAGQVDADNAGIISEIGVNLLPQALIDEITLSVLGGKGGGRLIPANDANITPFLQTPTQIIGDLLALRPGAQKNLHNPTIYNAARTTKQEEADIEKIKNHEFTEWTEMEFFSSEDDEKPLPNQAPYVRFASAIRHYENLTRNDLLAPIDDFDGEFQRGEFAEATHPQIANKKLPYQTDPKFDPKAHLESVNSSKFTFPLSSAEKVKYRSNPIVDKYPELRPSFEKMQMQLDQENGTELTVSWAPGGQVMPPKPLAIPDRASPEDVQDLLRFDDKTVQRPLFQQLRRTTRDNLKGSVPAWMTTAKRDPNHLVTKTIEANGDVTTTVFAADPDFVSTTTQVGTQTASDVDVNAIRPAGVPSIKTKALRHRTITAREAIAMGMDPNTYEGLLTRMQKDFVDERLDEFFATTNWGEDKAFTSNKYLRSLIMFTGLRKLEADPQVGAALMRDMLRGADIGDESTLYGGLSIQSFYQYVRTVEKEDKLQRMGKLDQYRSIIEENESTHLKQDLSANNPFNATRSDKERIGSPLLNLVRDIVDHAEAFGDISQNQPIRKAPTYNPFNKVTKFDKHSRVEEEYSGNESDFENVMVVEVDKHGLTTTEDKHNAEFGAMHAAMVKTKKSLNGLSIEEVERIFKVADQQPPVIRQVIVDLLREYLAAYPQNDVVVPALHVEGLDEAQNHTGHPLRNTQIMSANDIGSFIDQANPRGVFTLEEIDLSLVDLTKRFNMEHGNSLPAEDLSAFNKILVDCAREGRVYYPKPKLHEIKLEDNGALPDGTIGFDTANLAIGKLDQFKPHELRYSSDTVTLDTFNRIMSLPPAKLQTFMAYQDYINTHAENIAHKAFYKQLNSDIRAVRPHDSLSVIDASAAQHVRKMHTDRSQFDKYVMAPNGYIRLNENRAEDDAAIQAVVSRAKFGRTKGNDATLVRPHEFEPETEDPSYNFRVLDKHKHTYGPYTKEIMKDLYRDVISGYPTDFMTEGGDSTEVILEGNDVLENVVDADRPEDADLGRRFLNMQHWLGDPLSPRQLRVMKQMYEERKLEAYWQGTMNPFDSADVYNNLRMADKMIDSDTHMDHDRELARLHREIVIGVVREVLEDQDITMHSLEFDSYNLEPDFLPTYTHYDHVNVFAARRFSPYTTLPLSESNIPPMIGIEQQRNIYNLHLLDPVTFHPRWLARRLNVPYSQCIAILKTYDFRHRINMHETYEGTEAEYDDAVDGIDDSPLNPDFASVDLELPNPPEVQLSQMDEEYLYSRFAPNLIGRVSWTKRRERDIERTDPGFRHLLGTQDMFGGDGVSQFVDRQQEYMTKRYMEEEKILDALEQASFARFGPISFQTGREGQLHRPPKMPREIISGSLHPPTRANWALTTLDHSRKENTYGIMIRDRDGYLRHPTYREFYAIRLREKDRRVPFFWRRHHVLGKLPEISSLFVDQVTQIKADFDAKTNLAKDMRSAYDLNFVKQINYTPIANADDVKLRDSSDDPDAFDKQWGELRDNFAPANRLNDTTIRARDWLGEYDDEFRNANDAAGITEDEQHLIKTHNTLSPTGKDWNTTQATKRAATPLEVRLRRKLQTIFQPKTAVDPETGEVYNEQPLPALNLLGDADYEDLNIVPPPQPRSNNAEFFDKDGALCSDVEDFIVAGAEPEEFDAVMSAFINGDDAKREVIANDLLMKQLSKTPYLTERKLFKTFEDSETDVDPVDQLKDRITMKNIAARKAAESGKPYTADMAMIDAPSKQTLKDISMLRKGLKPTKEMYHYQRILARRGYLEDTPYGLAMPSTEDLESNSGYERSILDEPSDSVHSDMNGFGYGPEQEEFLNLYKAIAHDTKPLAKMAKKMQKMVHSPYVIASDNNSELSDAEVDQALGKVSPYAFSTVNKKEKRDGMELPGIDKYDPDYYRNRLETKIRRENFMDPLWSSTFYQRPKSEQPSLLATDNARHYLNEAEMELEHMANGPKGESAPTYIATLEPIHTSVGAYLLDNNAEARRIIKDSATGKHRLPLSLDELRAMTTVELDAHKKLLNDQLEWTDTSRSDVGQIVDDIDRHLEKLEESELGGDDSEYVSSGPEQLPTSISEAMLTSDSEWSRRRPDNEYSYIHHNQKVEGLHNRDVSENEFHDAFHMGQDMYAQTYGIPRNKLTSIQKQAIDNVRSEMNTIRSNKLSKLASAANYGEEQKYKTLRKALYDPNGELLSSAKSVTRVPTTSNLAENDPALAEYLNNVGMPNSKPKPTPYGRGDAGAV